jgi:hypothetical protein
VITTGTGELVLMVISGKPNGFSVMFIPLIFVTWTEGCLVVGTNRGNGFDSAKGVQQVPKSLKLPVKFIVVASKRILPFVPGIVPAVVKNPRALSVPETVTVFDTKRIAPPPPQIPLPPSAVIVPGTLI